MTDAAVEQAIAAAQAKVLADNPNATVAKNQDLARGLADEYDALLIQEKEMKERKEVLRNLILTLIDEGGEAKEELVIGDQVRFRRTVETRTYLATETLKERYPQSRYPQFYTESQTEVLRAVKPKQEKPKGRARRGR